MGYGTIDKASWHCMPRSEPTLTEEQHEHCVSAAIGFFLVWAAERGLVTDELRSLDLDTKIGEFHEGTVDAATLAISTCDSCLNLEDFEEECDHYIEMLYMNFLVHSFDMIVNETRDGAVIDATHEIYPQVRDYIDRNHLRAQKTPKPEAKEEEPTPPSPSDGPTDGPPKRGFWSRIFGGS